MSESIHLFFRSPLSFEEFLPWASDNLGLDFREIEGARYFGCHCEYLTGGTNIFAKANRWKTMDDCPLEGLNLEISVDKGRNEDVMFFVILAWAIMSAMKGADRAMLFWNCVSVANYVRNDRGLFDEISGKEFTLPKHFGDVFGLISKYN